MGDVFKLGMCVFALMSAMMGTAGIMSMWLIPKNMLRFFSQFDLGGVDLYFNACVAMILFGIQAYFWAAFY